jgi:hypothetical protein
MQGLGGAHRYSTASASDRPECRLVSKESERIVVWIVSSIDV